MDEETREIIQRLEKKIDDLEGQVEELQGELEELKQDFYEDDERSEKETNSTEI